MAAVLAAGQGAALSHRSAAELWRLLPAAEGPVHVTIPASAVAASRKNLHLHRSSLPDTATRHRNGIKATSPARTLRDLRRIGLEPELLRRATRQAEFLGLDLGEIATDHTRSELELAFLCLCRRFRLPEPEVNVRVGSFTVDFLWRAARLVVKVDGYAAHRGRQAFEDDRRRELELGRLGYRLCRFSPTQIHREARSVAAGVRTALRARES